jgi:hypothetical protein
MSPQLLDIENLVILVILAILFVFSLKKRNNAPQMGETVRELQRS